MKEALKTLKEKEDALPPPIIKKSEPKAECVLGYLMITFCFFFRSSTFVTQQGRPGRHRGTFLVALGIASPS